MNGVFYADDVAIVTACVRERYSLDRRVEIGVDAFEPNPYPREDDPLEIIEAAEAAELAT